MNALSFFLRRVAGPALWLLLGTLPGLAAPTLSQKIDPPEINLGDTSSVTITIQNGSASDIQLPHVDGLEIAGQRTQNGITIINGAMTTSLSVTFDLTPTHAGDFTIPAFDVTTQDGGTLHVHEMKLHVLSTATAPASPSMNPAQTPAPPDSNLPFNPSGPVVMPPNPPATPDTGGQNNTPAGPANSANSGGGFTPPVDPDGRPAKVFLVITPATTDAYVGQNIPVRIEFYIRKDVDAQQDSLPTIDGGDFLMNDLSERPEENPDVVVMNEDYRRDTWLTAIEAPKSGDFPLEVEQDSYWVKSIRVNAPSDDPLAAFFGPRRVLGHGNIPSNRLVIHVHALPQEGRPASFTGAIGQFGVTAEATPASVDVGDPVTLHFIVTGRGNFSYVQCPSLAPDPNWRAYVPSSKVEYADEAHTEGSKTFDQSVIPNKNGPLQLPSAGFSYFDPDSKQYVSVPITLPEINVTGSLPVAAAAPAPGSDNATPTAAAPPAAAGFLPNRVELGALQSGLAPVYEKPWFWAAQGGLILLLLSGLVATSRHSASNRDVERAELSRRRHSLRQEEEAMSEAVRQGDAFAFFLAARHAVQLQLGAQWRLQPEAITLAEVRERDPQLAASLEPLFTQADEIIYSGGGADGLDLAQWEIRVRVDLHQLQPA